MNIQSPFDRFSLTTAALCRAVAACLGRGLMTAPMIVLVWTRVRGAEWRFLALVERVRSGRYRAGSARAGKGEGADLGEAPGRVLRAGDAAARARLPLRFGWLMGVMPYEAACFAGQLRTVLDEPEMAGLVAGTAQARRILGPVCRMLGVRMPGEQVIGAQVSVSAPAAEEAVRVRKARAKVAVDWGRIPLPRGVLAAARRQGFGKVPSG